MRSLPAALALAATLAIALSGCGSPNGVSPSASAAKPTSTATATPAPTTTDTPSPSPSELPPTSYQSSPVTIDCSTLLNAQAVYDYNPNFSLQPKFVPAAGTDTATIIANQGVACSWVNQTSGVTFSAAVAQLAPADLTSIRGRLSASSSPVVGFGDAAFFQVSAGSGIAEIFSGRFWVVTASSQFYTIDDAAPLINVALSALGR